jgi:hypothetical protein
VAPNQHLLNKMKKKVTMGMNKALVAPFSAEEVKKTLYRIGDLKAHGPDGLHFFIRGFGQC